MLSNPKRLGRVLFVGVYIMWIDIPLHCLSNKQHLKPVEVCLDVETQAIVSPEKQHEDY